MKDKERHDIIKFLKTVAENRFAGEPLKHEIVPGDRSVSIACPYCGDSKTNPRNYRGNVYLKTKTFKCFNDGCFKWIPLREYVAHWSMEYGIDIMDLDIDFDMDFDPNSAKIVLADNTISQYLRDEGFLEHLLTIDYFIDRFDLVPITKATEGSAARVFCEGRDLYAVPNIGKFCYADIFDTRIYIFNYDTTNGRVLSFSTRILNEVSALKKKYDIFTYSRIIELLKIKSDIDDFSVIDTFGNYFNIMNVDFYKPITILEGQFDSFFIDNSIATTGLSKVNFLMEYTDKDITKILFDNDNGGRRESLLMLEHGYSTFLWSNLMSNLRKKFQKDIKILKKIKDINNLYSFLSSKGKISFDGFNKMINGYYSDSLFDMLFV